MTIDPTERTARIATLMDSLSVDDLRRTALQSVDHAYQSAAEVAEAWAMYEGAQATIAELMDENRRFRATVEQLRHERDLMISRRVWKGTQLFARPLRMARRRWSP